MVETKQRSACPVCGRSIGLTKAGTIRPHGSKERGVWPPQSCQGNGLLPTVAAPPAGSALDGLLGRPGDPVACKVINDDIAVHWYPTGAKPGDLCLCGATTKTEG